MKFVAEFGERLHYTSVRFRAVCIAK